MFARATHKTADPEASRPSHPLRRGRPSAGGSATALDAETRGLFESQFGHDFSRVRVHTDAAAARAARAENARAFTFGRDIYFGRDEYAPDTRSGRRLLAHELSHAVQQGAAPRAAATDAGALLHRVGSPRVQRQADEPAPARLGPECGASAATPEPDLPEQRDLTPDEHQYVNALETERVRMSMVAAGKLLDLRQRIITGDPELRRHPEGTPPAPARSWSQRRRMTDAEKQAEAAREAERVEKNRTLILTMRVLNIHPIYQRAGEAEVTWDWLNSPAAAAALAQIRAAEELIVRQARLRLVRAVGPRLPRETVARLGEDLLLFNPCFFHDSQFNTRLCFTWVLMHEYFHALGIYHGEKAPSHAAAKHTPGTPERALADVDALTRLVFDLSLEQRFGTDCHRFGA